LGGVAELATLFAVVFVLNVVPAFAPPTWMALSWVGFTRPLDNAFVVALIGALAATAGRLVLAKLSRVTIRQRFMSDTMRANIDVIKDGLERHRTLTFGAFLLYAFSPFPSNYLFIAYGLTSLPFWLVAAPFFIGRCVSYSFFVLTASKVSQRLALEATEAQPYFGIYFVISQLLLLGVVFLLTRIDWRYLVEARRFRWLRRVDLGRP
jgi:membrane protein YqaA with SNARE-associated domain